MEAEEEKLHRLTDNNSSVRRGVAESRDGNTHHLCAEHFVPLNVFNSDGKMIRSSVSCKDGSTSTFSELMLLLVFVLELS